MFGASYGNELSFDHSLISLLNPLEVGASTAMAAGALASHVQRFQL
jgi:hypothetical protein